MSQSSEFQKKGTGKSFSEALILASTNPQYDKRLFRELQVHYLHENSKLRTFQEHVVYMKLFWMSKQKQKTICVHRMFLKCSELGIFMYWTRNSMNNLSSYCDKNESFWQIFTCASLNQLWTNLDKFEPLWTSLNQFGQVWTTLDKFKPIWTSHSGMKSFQKFDFQERIFPSKQCVSKSAAFENWNKKVFLSRK